MMMEKNEEKNIWIYNCVSKQHRTSHFSSAVVVSLICHRYQREKKKIILIKNSIY